MKYLNIIGSEVSQRFAQTRITRNASLHTEKYLVKFGENKEINVLEEKTIYCTS